mgnify:CR=1 FL=1
MAKNIQAIRGMNDYLPGETAIWQRIEGTLKQVLGSYGYSEIRLPIVEQTPLFKRAIGEVTDVVEKEMYTFEDRNGDSLTLRPEGTAGCVRAGIEHGLLYNQEQRLWYIGPMFRHERPQRGRYRQFYQFGCEALGFAGPDVDIELLSLTARLWKNLGIKASLQLNSLGATEERARHREALVAYLKDNYDVLDEDARRRLETNPLRILDTKNPDMQAMVEAAPRLLDFLGEDSRRFLGTLEAGVQALGIEYTINPRLVRGLDYYNHTVFEWVTDQLGSQGTICGGGRYDPLIEILGGRATPAAGFAIGAERVIELVRAAGGDTPVASCEIYVVHQGGHTELVARQIGEQLRDAGHRVIVHAGSTSFKSSMKRADQSLAQWAVVCGENEVNAGQVAIKRLRDAQGNQQFAEQMTIGIESLSEIFGSTKEGDFN